MSSFSPRNVTTSLIFENDSADIFPTDLNCHQYRRSTKGISQSPSTAEFATVAVPAGARGDNGRGCRGCIQILNGLTFGSRKLSALLNSN